jgi:hypothetical protein
MEIPMEIPMLTHRQDPGSGITFRAETDAWLGFQWSGFSTIHRMNSSSLWLIMDKY